MLLRSEDRELTQDKLCHDRERDGFRVIMEMKT